MHVGTPTHTGQGDPRTLHKRGPGHKTQAPPTPIASETRELTDVQVASRIDERLYFASLAGHLPPAAKYTIETLDPTAAEAAGHTYRVQVHLAEHVHAHCTKIVDIATRVPSGYGKELAARVAAVTGAYAAPSAHRVNRSAKITLVNAGD
jgi:hypothetical protein